MTYTEAAVLGVAVALVLDVAVLRTRLVGTRQWWLAYAIVLFFQLVTNGWLTGRRIVTYDPAAILGSGAYGDPVPFIGDGRLVFAPVEDVAFGFALVLTTCAWWSWLGRHRVRGWSGRTGVDRDPSQAEATSRQDLADSDGSASP